MERRSVVAISAEMAVVQVVVVVVVVNSAGLEWYRIWVMAQAKAQSQRLVVCQLDSARSIVERRRSRLE